MRTPLHVLTAGTTAAALIAVTSCGIVEEEPSGPEVTASAPESASASPEPPENAATPVEDLLEQQGVSAGHPLAVAAGEQILAEGGNAVDAAIATAFAISVVEPYASGIGGGGSVIIAGPEGEPIFYDYREVVNNDGEIPDSGAGVPGFVAGMGQLHEDYGTMEWSELLAPAQELADDGFEVSEFLGVRMSQPDAAAAISDLEHYAPGGEILQAGETLVQEDLAQTLQTLSQNGWQDFYTGGLAESLASAAEGIDAESLADYEVVRTSPVAGEFGEFEVVSAAPGLPGPALIQMLQIAEAQGVAQMEPDSAEYIDTLSRAWLEAESTVYNDLGDPAFVDVPVDRLTDREANAQIELSAQALGAPSAAAEDAPNTTHISVVDSDGLTVSMTNTIMFFWGSGEMVDGYFLNNHLSRFEAIDTPANQPEPGRRTVTWSTPTMVLDGEGQPLLAIGSPGGHQILNILSTVLVQWGLQGATLEEAIEAPRFRAASDGETLYLEDTVSEEVISELEDMGWQTEIWPVEQASFGSVQPVLIDYETGQLHSTDDPRREGAHAVIP
ncbi:gamma-glutamyltransferase family protein [Nesterenkonia flava]|uniref:Gamma-glutamyltransferase n=1 Tax=Nesterenkonia flava TaxID=469799 RepID=A0ABU1FVU3_9MICC|nr:gamma-glutamyltransferase [Nesterenkonia flava]MDR5712795.1 gamma-glutamyltransferase [Nesterenkonia flava]